MKIIIQYIKFKQVLIISCMVILFCNTFAQLPIVNGWTQFTPSNDSRIIYVSSNGNNATAQIYSVTSPEIGANPFLPTGNIQAFQTINAALTQVRDNYPDWILFKNGDTFTNQNFGIITFSGRNYNEPILIGAYGSHLSRPRILTGNQNALSIGYYAGNNVCNYIAICGISFEPHTRNGTDEPIGLQIFAHFNSILIEDCLFEKFHNHITILDPNGGQLATRKNFKVRRSTLIDAYTTGNSHANAIFIQNVDTILFEENLLDHNGWNTTIAGALPTPFRHNSYFQVGNKNLVFKNNIVSRAAATGGGHRCGGKIIDNLYLSNPQNLQFGTHENTINWPTEFVEGEIAYNVVLDCRIEPFEAGRGIRLQRVKNTKIHHNIVAHFTPLSDYNLGLFLDETENVQVSKNIIYKWGNNINTGPAFSTGIGAGAGLIGNNYIDSNDVQMKNTQGYCMNINANQNNIDFSYNRYYNVNNANDWFQPSGNFSSWLNTSNELGALSINIPYIDPERNISSYLTYIGLNGSLNDFINYRKNMSKSNWNNEISANACNNYIRQGFNMNPLGSTNQIYSDDFSLSIYPNPNKYGYYYCELLNNLQNKTSYSIYDINGKKLHFGFFENNKALIKLNNEMQGIYILKIQNKEMNKTFKLIKD